MRQMKLKTPKQTLFPRLAPSDPSSCLDFDHHKQRVNILLYIYDGSLL